jgi:uncharacterized protein (DUF885 family)
MGAALTTKHRSASQSQDDESSLDEETRLLLEREAEECRTLESQAKFIKESLQAKSTDTKGIVKMTNDVAFFEQAFCTLEQPRSGYSTPNSARRLSSDLSAKMTQDIKAMSERLDYMTSQVQHVNNKYISIQNELLDVKKEQASRCGGSGRSCFCC